jgi:hypothetical protein
MKSTLPKLAGLLGLVAALCVHSAMGQGVIHFRATADSDGPAATAMATDKGGSPFVPESTPMAPASPAAVAAPCGCCDDCCGCKSCGCGCGCCKADCDECPGIGIELFTGVEDWRGITNGDLQDNAGLVAGGNIGVPIPGLREYGIGAQFGARYSASHLDGEEVSPSLFSSTDVPQQVFLTTGFFRRAFDGEHFSSRFSVGIAHDWMIADSFGDYGTSVTLSQWRGQVGFALSAQNEIGVWGTLRDGGARGSFQVNNGQSILLTLIQYQAIDQVNFFWHHNFNSGANSWLYFGFPQQTTISPGGGSLGTWTMGAKFLVPISERVALYAEGTYMRPSAVPSANAAIENGYSIGFGLAFYPGGNAGTRTVAGNCWMPYLPVANNGSFLVDTNTVF